MQIDRPIAIAITLFIILLLIFFLVVPEYKTFGKLRVDFGIKKAQFNAEFDYYATIADTYFNLQSRQDDLKKIDDALPKDSSLGKLVYFLQQTAKQNGMMFKDLVLSKSSSGGADTKVINTVKDVVFSVDLLGSYESLGKFIVALEKSSRIFEITSIAFSSGAGAVPKATESQFQIQQTYSFSLQIKTHTY